MNQVDEIITALNEIHKDLAKCMLLPSDEYQPISSKLIQIKQGIRAINDTHWTPITGEASLPKDDEALCVLARYTSKGELRTTPVEKVGFFKGMLPLNEFQFYTILQPPVK